MPWFARLLPSHGPVEVPILFQTRTAYGKVSRAQAPVYGQSTVELAADVIWRFLQRLV